ncbi:MAG: 6-carboxytetrahydropterin synthase QueD [Abditibacteriota bacterium]|nr:6-carboxytetrahydropterin synthase QueD [Abditibacteriota bacterium]MBP5738193.1 6-carboxytetrahydropterin synthase QueD [Abditibacteriota bacterium]
MYRIRIEDTFDAAHNLRNYPGSCRNLHGHTYRVRVEFLCRELDEMGMAIDFRVAKPALRKVLERLDHNYINELPEFAEQNPTAENIARFIYNEIKPEIPELCSVTLWETPTSSVIYTED